MAEDKQPAPAAAEGSQPSPAARAEDNQSVGVRDRVVMASRFSDGVTPAQSEEWEFIGDKEAVKAGARHQHVSAALANLDPVTSDGPFPSAEEREKAVGPAEKRADAEVEAKHRGLGDDGA